MEKEIRVRITKIGGSNFALLPKKALSELKLFTGNYAKIIIKPIYDELEQEINMKFYMCRSCQRGFNTDDKPYCPVCGAEGSSIVELPSKETQESK